VTAKRPVFLGLDLGTSAIKAVAVGEDGAVDAVARHGFPTARPQPGAAEQNPHDWFTAAKAVLDDLARTVPPDSWVGMGLTAMLPTLVECDELGGPLTPAITWEDARAEPEATALRKTIGDDTLYRITGQRVDGRYLGPMHARLFRLGRAGAIVAGAKDVLFAHLTGELLTDPSTAAGSAVYDIERGLWDAELVEAAQIPRLPVVSPAATTRPLRPAWQQRLGLPSEFPVVLGAADSVLGALGVGAARHGDVAVIAGTSAIVLGISDAPTRDGHRRYLVTPMTGAGWGLEMDLLAMGSAFDAIARLLGLPGPRALLEAAAAVDRDDAPLFLPYLAPGEQGALWDPELAGTVHGLHLGMTAGHIGRALLTGVVVELRRCVSVLEATTGRRGPVMLGGRSAVSSLMWRDIADATGREVRVNPTLSDHSAIGAAVFAADSLGVSMPRRGDAVSIAPRSDMYDWWTESLARHDALRLSLGGR
jgi:sugar (pentulose or hexulose) kinase